MKKIYLFIFLLMFLTSVSNAQTTYTWNVAGDGSWATAANWTPTRTVPATNDIMVISNGGSKTISDIPNQTIGKLQISGGTTVILRPETTGNRTLTVSTVAADAITVASGSTLTIAGRDAATDRTLTLTTSNTAGIIASIDGTIGVALDNAQSGATGAFTKGAAATINMNSGSMYTHGRDAGTIPTATWAATSTCTITGLTTNFPGGIGQSFGNLIFSSVLGGNNTLNADFTCVNLTMSNTGSPNVIRGTNSGTARTVTVTGNFSQTSGDFVLTSDNGNVTLDVAGNFSVSGGTFDFNNDNGSGNATLNVAGNFSHTAGTITRLDLTGSGTAGIFFDGSSTQSFTSGGTIGTGVNYTVNSGSTLQMSATGTVVSGNSFTLSSGATLDITSTAGITSSGATGNIQTTTRTYSTGGNYRYIGTGGAQVSGNGLPATVNSLTINNASGVSLTNAATANSASSPLTLTSGILSGATLTIGSAYIGAGGGGSASSHVSSSLAKTGNTAYEFPVGNGTVYRPISVSSLSASATITASYTQANPETAFGTSVGSGINHISKCEYWNLDDGVATITGMVGLKFGGSCNSNPYVDDPATLRVAHWSGSTWEDKGNNGSATSTNVQGNIASSFSPFTIGSSGVLNPLPVKLGNIKAFEKQSGVQIEWTAYQEENLSRYAVERSANGSTFISIGEVAARNSASETSYGFFDANPLQGINFYRLRSIDMDSKSAYSSIVKVNLDKGVKDISLYPNPATGGYISFQGSDLMKGNYTVKVFNSTGMQVMSQNFVHTGGAITQTLKLPSGISSGMYSLQLVNDGVKVMSKTFMVQ